MQINLFLFLIFRFNIKSTGESRMDPIGGLRQQQNDPATGLVAHGDSRSLVCHLIAGHGTLRRKKRIFIWKRLLLFTIIIIKILKYEYLSHLIIMMSFFLYLYMEIYLVLRGSEENP